MTDWRSAVDRKLTALAVARKARRQEKRALAESAGRLAALAEAQELAQRVAAEIQTQAHHRIAEIVTKCLAIFDEPYTFRILFDRKRGKTEARLVFELDGEEIDPLSASGGGVVDVAAFALRVAALVLHRPALRRLLVLDEPFRFVSKEYHGRVRALVEGLARELGVQFVIVTHCPRLCAGRVIEL